MKEQSIRKGKGLQELEKQLGKMFAMGNFCYWKSYDGEEMGINENGGTKTDIETDVIQLESKVSRIMGENATLVNSEMKIGLKDREVGNAKKDQQIEKNQQFQQAIQLEVSKNKMLIQELYAQQSNQPILEAQLPFNDIVQQQQQQEQILVIIQIDDANEEQNLKNAIESICEAKQPVQITNLQEIQVEQLDEPIILTIQIEENTQNQQQHIEQIQQSLNFQSDIKAKQTPFANLQSCQSISTIIDNFSHLQRPHSSNKIESSRQESQLNCTSQLPLISIHKIDSFLVTSSQLQSSFQDIQIAKPTQIPDRTSPTIDPQSTFQSETKISILSNTSKQFYSSPLKIIQSDHPSLDYPSLPELQPQTPPFLLTNIKSSFNLPKLIQTFPISLRQEIVLPENKERKYQFPTTPARFLHPHRLNQAIADEPLPQLDQQILLQLDNQPKQDDAQRLSNTFGMNVEPRYSLSTNQAVNQSGVRYSNLSPNQMPTGNKQNKYNLPSNEWIYQSTAQPERQIDFTYLNSSVGSANISLQPSPQAKKKDRSIKIALLSPKVGKLKADACWTPIRLQSVRRQKYYTQQAQINHPQASLPTIIHIQQEKKLPNQQTTPSSKKKITLLQRNKQPKPLDSLVQQQINHTKPQQTKPGKIRITLRARRQQSSLICHEYQQGEQPIGLRVH